MNPKINSEWNIWPNHVVQYLKSCDEFSNSDEKFNTFKQDERYKLILEHISKAESDMFVSEMKDSCNLSDEQIEKFRENDLYGTPTICDYERFGKMSPSTIRYIKNTLDIFNFIGDKNIKNIVEIGGGYGGLCKTMSVLFDFDNYVLIDLPECNKLSNKYLSKFEELSGKTNQYSFDEFEEIENVDLVISNYAFSECSRTVQEMYYNNVVLNSDYFYMVYNNNVNECNMTPQANTNYNPDSFLEMSSNDFEIVVEEEVRHSHTNYIYYATKK